MDKSGSMFLINISLANFYKKKKKQTKNDTQVSR